MKKQLIILCLLLVVLFTSCRENTNDQGTPLIIEDGNEISILLQRGEKFFGFSIASDGHTLWISSSDSNGEIHIRRYYSTVSRIDDQTHFKVTNNN